MPFTIVPTRTTADPNSAADVNTLMENSTFTKSSRNRVDGLLLSNSPGDTPHDITIAAGICKDSTFVYTLELTSALTKRIDAAWSAGDTGGFLDTGSVAINTQYAVWLIRKDSDGTSDAVASTSFTAPSMPTGYTYKRLLRGFATNASSQIINNQWLITDVVNDRGATIICAHEVANTTNGGTYTTAAWRTRPLVTVRINEIPGASLATNQIILPAGSYYVIASQTMATNSFIQGRIYDATNAAVKAIGVSTNISGARGGITTVQGYFTLAAQAAIELQMYGTSSVATIGMGEAASFGTNECFADIKIIKVG